MKMTRSQKRFVNRRKKAEPQIDNVRQHLEQLDVEAINDVLEIGCGIGIISAFLAEEYGWKVRGTDVDPEQIEIAREMQPEGEGLHFGIEDAARLTFDDASFDLVLSQFVFHHMAEWELVVREVVRVLRPGGHFMWLDVAFLKVFKKILRPVMKNFGLYTIDEARAAFERNGLASRSYTRLPYGPFKFHDLLLQKS
jgi:ubiquinone/menaquinone biosynthesis C-methylase UbiE